MGLMHLCSYQRIKFFLPLYIMNTTLVITAIVSAIVSGFFVYLDAKLFDNPKPKTTYLKVMFLVSSVATAAVYFMGGAKVSQLGGQAPRIGTSLVSGINEEILSGMPGF